MWVWVPKRRVYRNYQEGLPLPVEKEEHSASQEPGEVPTACSFFTVWDF